MRIGDKTLPQDLLTIFRPPHLSVAEKEALRPRAAVDDGRLDASGRFHIGAVADRDPCEIADVLAEREPAVDV